MFGMFQFNFKQALIVLILLALPIIAINLEKRDPGALRWYDRPMAYFISPLQNGFANFSTGVTNTASYYLNLLNIKKENRELKDLVEKMKIQLNAVEEVKAENARLEKLLFFHQIAPPQLVAGQVIATDLFSPEYSTLKINRGSRDGIRKGMGAITPDGVVGYVLNTQNSYATILTLTDRFARIDAMVQRTRARGVAEGLGKDAIKLKYLQRSDDVQPGDAVITGGQDGVFPKGLLIGTVTRVTKPKFGVTQNVELKPTMDVSRVEELLIITDAQVQLARAEPSPQPLAEPKTEPKGAKK